MQLSSCLKGNGQGPWSNSWSLLSIPPFNNKCLGYSHIQRGSCQVKRRINRTLPMALLWSLKCSFRLDAPVLSNISNVNQENSSAWMNMTTTKLKSLVNVELTVGLRQFRLLLFSSFGQKVNFPIFSQIVVCQNGVAVHGIYRIISKVILNVRKEKRICSVFPVSTRATVYNSTQDWKCLAFYFHSPEKYLSATHKQLGPWINLNPTGLC